MKIGVIIQARTSSTRLPEKVLKELPYNSGITVLEQVIRRVKKVSKVNAIIVATTTDPEDEKIINIAIKEGVNFFKGSKENVLERYYLAAKDNNLDIVIRITSDCPCIDPLIIDAAIEEHINQKADYTSNSIVRSFPHGLDTEVFNFSALEKSFKEASDSFEKEHVTYYIYNSNPSAFKINSVVAPVEITNPEIRITLDTKEDYILLCAVYDFLFENNDTFSAKDVVELFRSKPWLAMINKSVLQKKKYESEAEEIQDAIKLLNLQELTRAKEFLALNYKFNV
jgi:spore coat polysaccharide biosynthesis protein SpsF